jgi:NADH dehydrogenase (ubiquinone) 1 alpha subcomplex subunit 9
LLTPLQAQGEQVARSIFPETTIVRPAPIFGFEDKLLLRLAHALNLFTANNMQERFSPVHVRSPSTLTSSDNRV